MASAGRALTWKRLLLTILALWILAGIVSVALTYLGHSGGPLRLPAQHSVRR